MATPARTLYASQQCEIDGKNYAVQSASCELTIPVDDILILGKLGSAGRFQKEVSTCKSDVKIFMGLTATGDELNGTAIKSLMDKSLDGETVEIDVTPGGFEMDGILTSVGLELTKGNFAMADLSFVGVGEPTFAAVPTSVGDTGDVDDEGPSHSIAVTPITTAISVTALGGATGTSCPNSAKFSLDIPTEIISCLGGVIEGNNDAVKGDNVQVAKPPFKGTIVIEGTSAESAEKLVFGDGAGVVSCEIKDATITSRSFNQAAGDVGASYSFTVEGSDISIT